MKKLIRTLALVLCLMTVMGTVCECLASFSATVISSGMKIYSKKDTSKQYVIGTLKKGKTFKVVSYSGDWAKVSLNGKTGYAKISAMKFSSGKTMYTKSSTSVYKTASGSGKIGTLSKNTKVSVVGWSGSYYLIKKDGKLGYVSKSRLSSSYTATTAYLKNNAVIYGSASSSNPKATMLKGTKVSVKGTSGNYAKVSISGSTAYVKKSSLSTSHSSPSKKTMYAKSACTVYKFSGGSGTLGKLTRSAKVSVVGEAGSYYAIAAGSKVGFVAKSNLSSSKPSSSGSSGGSSLMPKELRSTQSTYSGSLSNEKKLEYVIYCAQKKLGTKYGSGNDCLMLCLKSYSAAHISIADTPAGCAKMGMTTIYSTGSLKRGDLVCFDTSDKGSCNHVGIYLGSGKFIHSSSSAGKVIVSSLSSGFYYNAFLCGKRVF